MKINKIKRFEIQRVTSFNWKRKIGIDTNILIRIYEQPFLLDNEASRIFNYNDLIFTHAICKWEFIKKLKKNGLFEEQAKKEASSFLKDNNIKIIYPQDCLISLEKINEFEKESNRKFKEIGKERLKCHKPDSIIILAFHKCGINKILSTDESFREAAKFLGIDSFGLPSINKTISRELYKMFNLNKYKCKRKKR